MVHFKSKNIYLLRTMNRTLQLQKLHSIAGYADKIGKSVQHVYDLLKEGRGDIELIRVNKVKLVYEKSKGK